MSRPILYVAITNHGFGHATRIRGSGNSEVVSRNPADFGDNGTALVARVVHPEILSIARVRCLGVVQADSLMMDKAATLAKLNSCSAAIAHCRGSHVRQNRG